MMCVQEGVGRFLFFAMENVGVMKVGMAGMFMFVMTSNRKMSHYKLFGDSFCDWLMPL